MVNRALDTKELSLNLIGLLKKMAVFQFVGEISSMIFLTLKFIIITIKNILKRVTFLYFFPSPRLFGYTRLFPAKG